MLCALKFNKRESAFIGGFIATASAGFIAGISGNEQVCIAGFVFAIVNVIAFSFSK